MSLKTDVLMGLRLARRELAGGLKGFGVLVLCLALGVAAIAAIGSLRMALERGLSDNGAILLGGDAQVSLTYRFANPSERNILEENSDQLSEIADFRSLAASGEQRLLTQIKAVDTAYPLTGEVLLDPPIKLAQALAPQEGLNGAVMDPALIARLGLKIGDSFGLGEGQFRLTAALMREPDSVASGITLGPRTLTYRSALESAGLLKSGTLFNSSYRLKLPAGTDLDALQLKLETALPDAGLRWSDARNAAPAAAGFIERIGAFLVLVGFSGLAMGGIGVSMATQAYLARKTRVIATLRSLGAERRLIFISYGLQIGALALVGICLGLLAGAALPLLLGPMLATQLPVPASFAFYPAPLVEAALYGVLTAVIFTLWPLSQHENTRAASLFRDSNVGKHRLPRWPYLLACVVFTALLLALAAWFSGSLRLTAYTALTLALSLAALALTALLVRAGARALQRRIRLSPMLKLALAAIGGAGSEALTTILSLGLGLTVLSAVGQVDGNLRASITGNLPKVAPSYFFIDIQKDQMQPLRDMLTAREGVRKIEAAPMLRGIISKINGRPAAEIAGDHWVLDGDRGVTYYDALPETWKLTAGTNWPKGANGSPQLSFAAEEAEEMGLKLGDVLTVNILGRAIDAEITSFREVDFSTAGIGFIMAMNPGAVASAPHSFIATVYAEVTAEAALLNEVSRAYPNVTAIRVRDAITRVSEVLGALASATRWGAAAAILSGFVVLIGAAGASAAARAREAAILKTLGASRRAVLMSFLIRAALLGAFAALIALIAGIIAAWAVAHYLFESSFNVIWPQAALILACGVIANLAANTGFSLRALRTRPASILRHQS
ncbi:FtsX-like permease family protein [Lentibacter algarum]|uniref:ABC transporter permease n=1 Tax=Lentibacter algarum TaxID=576131 RepID=UPI001C0716EC|nr:FtsX-like permease family protein [Lentibacter algarum]MBU2980881.1 FtsX-like permease family protein [Lentibacter algarum]